MSRARSQTPLARHRRSAAPARNDRRRRRTSRGLARRGGRDADETLRPGPRGRRHLARCSDRDGVAMVARRLSCAAARHASLAHASARSLVAIDHPSRHRGVGRRIDDRPRGQPQGRRSTLRAADQRVRAEAPRRHRRCVEPVLLTGRHVDCVLRRRKTEEGAGRAAGRSSRSPKTPPTTAAASGSTTTRSSTRLVRQRRSIGSRQPEARRWPRPPLTKRSTSARTAGPRCSLTARPFSSPSAASNIPTITTTRRLKRSVSTPGRAPPC